MVRRQVRFLGLTAVALILVAACGTTSSTTGGASPSAKQVKVGLVTDIGGLNDKSFTLSMLETAIELTKARIPAADLEVILGWGKRMLMQPTELLSGVEGTLRTLAQDHDLILITKGDLFDQESKLARSGLGELFEGVEILSEKTAESYRQVLQRRSIAPRDFVMVGNSLRSDVVPVVELGATAVHIPYHVTWRHEQVDEAALPERGWHRLEGIHELGGLLAALDSVDESGKVQELQSRTDRNRKRASGPL